MSGITGIRLKIDPPGKFGGTPTDNYDEYTKKLRNYMSLNDARYNELMRWAQSEQLPISDETMDANDEVDDTEHTTKRLGIMLYYVLSSLTEGTAYVIVDQVDEQNG